MAKADRKRKYDYSGFFRGEPIRIDITEHNSTNVERAVRNFLAMRGYKSPHIEKTYDTRPPFKAWLISDWQRNAKTTIEKKKEHPWHEVIEKGIVKVRPENWQTMEQAKNAFVYYIKSLGYRKRPFWIHLAEDYKGKFWHVMWMDHPLFNEPKA